MGVLKEPGGRPVAWWLCELSTAEVRRMERTHRSHAEALLAAGLCGPAERQEIADRGVIAWEHEFWKQHRAKHPGKYTRGQLIRI